MKDKDTPTIPPDYRAVFLDSGLRYGRHFGSKSNYSRTNPGCLFVANACVFTRQQHCVWRGDLDLSTEEDVQGLIGASRLLNRKLFVLREQTHDQIPLRLKAWFAASVIVTIWHGRVTAGGDFRRLQGRFSKSHPEVI